MGASQVVIGTRVPASLRSAVEHAAEEQGVSLSAFTRGAIRRELAHQLCSNRLIDGLNAPVAPQQLAKPLEQS